ncbi:hypothetical protein NP233_g8867 [Leucocoprinus birnbaumii]|uniref:Uncharacterized protein n=1 Tax=Leucocoprinus birnbaumii TaxID=56174 RepID=A0AAD5VLM4_9AGAR|nr:hypothetical protein NP233_g8867 [Leucocoprinus birnbaumii]
MLTYTFEKGFSLSDQIQSISFSSNGKYLAAGLDDRVYIWDTATWLLNLRFRRDAVPIRALTWDNKGRLFFGCDGGILTMVTLNEQEYLSEGFCASERPIRHIAVSVMGNFLALGGDDEVTIWSYRAGASSRAKWEFVKRLSDPQDKLDKTSVNVSGLAWASGFPQQLVVAYDKQGVVTWDIEENIPLFKAGKTHHHVGVRSSHTDAPNVLIGGGAHYAIPSGRELRVYFRENGRDFRCLTSPGIIPSGAPMAWAHDGTCIVAAMERDIVLLQIEKRLETKISLKDCIHVSHLSWNRSTSSKGSMYRLAVVTNRSVLRVLRADSNRAFGEPRRLSDPHSRFLYCFSTVLLVLLVALINESTPSRFQFCLSSGSAHFQMTSQETRIRKLSKDSAMSRVRDKYGNVIFNPYNRPNDSRIHASDALLIGELKSTYVSATNRNEDITGQKESTFEKLVISTPNADYLPLVNVGQQVISIYVDGRWGAEDYAQWPQWYFDGREHFPYILRKPSAEALREHPLRRLWWNMTEVDFERNPGDEDGKLEQSIAQELFDIRTQLMEEVKLCVCNDGLVWSKLQACAGKMRQCTSTLLYTPQPYLVAMLTLAAAQRYCLETRAMLDRIADIGKNHASDDYPPANHSLLGCITNRVPVVYEMYEKGIPVWFVWPLSRVTSDTSIVAQGLVLLPAEFGVELKRWPGAPIFYQGRLARDIHNSIENWRPGNMDLRLLCGESIIPGEMKDAEKPKPEGHKEKKNRVEPYSKAQAAAKVASKRPNISINKDLFRQSSSAYMPNMPDVWKRALQSIDANTDRVVQHPDIHLFRGYAFPPAHMFCGEDDKKSLEHMLGWLVVRNSWIGSFGDVARTSALPGPQQWRTYLRGIALGLELTRPDDRKQASSMPETGQSTRSHSTRRGAKLKEKAREIFESIQVPSKNTLQHILWNGSCVWRRNELHFSILDRRVLVWDVIDHNFRIELMTMDQLLMAKEWKNTGTRLFREIKLNALWPNVLLLSTELPSPLNSGLTVDNLERRRPLIEAFRRIVMDWPGDTPQLLSRLSFHKCVDGKDIWDEEMMIKVEALAAAHYCQVFFDHFGRAPCVPCTFPVA